LVAASKQTYLRAALPRHMWTEFVGSLICSDLGFSPGTPVFPSPQKPTFDFDLI